VFEDVNYGGGVGRNLVAATAAAPSFTVGRPNAVVELYDNSGNLDRTTTTGAGGEYGFAGLVDGDYDVRVVNSSVTSSRTGATGTEWSVQTYRVDASTGTAVAVTDRVGGATPGSQDGPQNPGAANLSSFTAQSVARAKVITGISVTDVDFGYSFDCIVNKNNSGQGSLRQWLLNANALANTNLAQAGRWTGTDTPSGCWPTARLARPQCRHSHAVRRGVASITLTSALPAMSTPAVLDAQTQPGWSSAPLVELNGAARARRRTDCPSPPASRRARADRRPVHRERSLHHHRGGDTIAGCRIEPTRPAPPRRRMAITAS